MRREQKHKASTTQATARNNTTTLIWNMGQFVAQKLYNNIVLYTRCYLSQTKRERERERGGGWE